MEEDDDESTFDFNKAPELSESVKIPETFQNAFECFRYRYNPLYKFFRLARFHVDGELSDRYKPLEIFWLEGNVRKSRIMTKEEFVQFRRDATKCELEAMQEMKPELFQELIRAYVENKAFYEKNKKKKKSDVDMEEDDKPQEAKPQEVVNQEEKPQGVVKKSGFLSVHEAFIATAQGQLKQHYDLAEYLAEGRCSIYRDQSQRHNVEQRCAYQRINNPALCQLLEETYKKAKEVFLAQPVVPQKVFQRRYKSLEHCFAELFPGEDFELAAYIANPSKLDYDNFHRFESLKGDNSQTLSDAYVERELKRLNIEYEGKKLLWTNPAHHTRLGKAYECAQFCFENYNL